MKRCKRLDGEIELLKLLSRMLTLSMQLLNDLVHARHNPPGLVIASY